MTRALLGVGMLLLSGAGELTHNGDAQWRRGNFRLAADWYEQASALAPGAPELLYNGALAWYRAGRYDDTARLLDRAQPLAHGTLLAKCLLLRADMEYRNVTSEPQPAIREVEGLERALRFYRDALAAGGEKSLNETARYNIEVVKLRLPASEKEAAGSAQKNAPSQPESSSAQNSSPKTSGHEGGNNSDDRDW